MTRRSGRIVFGSRPPGAIEIEELVQALETDPAGLLVDPHGREHSVEGEARPGLEVWSRPDTRSQEIFRLRVGRPGVTAQVKGYQQHGLWTSSGFWSLWPGVPPGLPGYANPRLVKRLEHHAPVEAAPGSYMGSNFVLTPYGIVIPAKHHRFVTDYLNHGDLAAAYLREWPKDAGRYRLVKRARDKMADPTTHAFFVNEMATAIVKAKGGKGVAGFIVDSMIRCVDKSLDSDQPWRAIDALQALAQIANANLEARETLEARGAPVGALATNLPAIVPARQPTRQDLETAEALVSRQHREHVARELEGVYDQGEAN